MMNMMPYPKYYKISSGAASATQRLVSFDAALIEAGISNYNLLRVSSILPIECTRKAEIDKLEGSALLVAYGSFSSNIPGQKIASAVGVGIPKDKTQVGVIMEYAAEGDAKTAEAVVREMVEQAMKNHGILCEEIQTSSAEATVVEGYATVISALAMW